MLRCAWLLLSCLLLAACGPRCDDTPATTWHAVADAPWAQASPAQVEAARRMGVPVAFENARGMRFVFVPSGTCRMGTGAEEHEVRISVGFYLQTQAGSACTLADARRLGAELTTADDVWTYRLPTEAEWVHARALGNPTLAGMGDGRAEWCRDRFGPLASWTVVDPEGPNEGAHHVVRDVAEGRAARGGTARAGVRLAVPLGYGLGRYGSVPVTFRLTHPASGARIDARSGDYDLRVIRMNDRLAARTRGVDPEWARVPRPGSPVTLTMVPGKYYVYAERTREGRLTRGLEIKFHVWEHPTEVPVPVPEADLGRYGSGAAEKPQ